VAIQFNFRASNVTSSLPAADNIVLCTNELTNAVGSTTFASGPSEQPISDAENRVTFSVTGVATPTCDVLMTLRTRHRFQFRPTENGRLTASTFFTPSFVFSLACAGEAGIFNFFDKAGPITINVFVRMSVRVTAQNGAIVLNSNGANRNIFSRLLTGQSFPVSQSGGFAPELMDVIETRSFATEVRPSDQVRLDARYVVQALAIDTSTFTIDADGGLGLNVPMAVIRVDP